MRAAHAVGDMNNVTDAHFGTQSFVTQQFRVNELRNVAWAECLSSSWFGRSGVLAVFLVTDVEWSIHAV